MKCMKLPMTKSEIKSFSKEAKEEASELRVYFQNASDHLLSVYNEGNSIDYVIEQEEYTRFQKGLLLERYQDISEKLHSLGKLVPNIYGAKEGYNRKKLHKFPRLVSYEFESDRVEIF